MSSETEKNEKQLKSLGLSVKDLEAKVEVPGRGEFVIKALYPYEKTFVIRLLNQQIGQTEGDGIDINYVRMICTLSQCIKDAPEWWPGADACIDTELLIELYNKYTELEENLHERLKKNRPSK